MGKKTSDGGIALVAVFLATWIVGIGSRNTMATKESWIALVTEDHRPADPEVLSKEGITFNVVHSHPKHAPRIGKLSGMKIYEFVASRDEARAILYPEDGALDSSVWYLEKNHPIYVVGNSGIRTSETKKKVSNVPKKGKEWDSSKIKGNANKKTKWLDYSSAPSVQASSTYCRFSNDGGIPGFNPGYFGWGVDLLDQKGSALDLQYCPVGGSDGTGATVHILDTGIYMHSTFDDQNIIKEFDFFEADPSASNFCVDGFGHGTHTAGLVASSAYGGAPGTTLRVYKVLNDRGSGSLASLASGLAYIYSQNYTKGTISMSLGAGNVVSTVVTTYVNALIRERDFIVVVAAGNGDEDACENYPANIPGVVSVGAIDISMSRDTDYSNYGTCVTLFAPGTNIISCGISNREASQIMTGTSMATPLVASVCAVLWSAYPSYHAAQITSIMVANTIRNSLTNVGTGSPNYRVYDGSVSPQSLPGYRPPSNPPPPTIPHPPPPNNPFPPPTDHYSSYGVRMDPTSIFAWFLMDELGWSALMGYGIIFVIIQVVGNILML